MKFKDKETREKITTVKETEVVKPQRLQLSQEEYDLLLDMLSVAVNRRDLKHLKLLHVVLSGEYAIHTTENVEATLEIELS